MVDILFLCEIVDFTQPRSIVFYSRALVARNHKAIATNFETNRVADTRDWQILSNFRKQILGSTKKRIQITSQLNYLLQTIRVDECRQVKAEGKVAYLYAYDLLVFGATYTKLYTTPTLHPFLIPPFSSLCLSAFSTLKFGGIRENFNSLRCFRLKQTTFAFHNYYAD